MIWIIISSVNAEIFASSILRCRKCSLGILSNVTERFLFSRIFRGCYPPLYDRKFEPGDWFSSYVATYIERDVRQILHVRDLSTFQRFVKMCADRTGQLLNLSSLANDCGITHNTAGAWVSILKASGQNPPSMSGNAGGALPPQGRPDVAFSAASSAAEPGRPSAVSPDPPTSLTPPLADPVAPPPSASPTTPTSARASGDRRCSRSSEYSECAATGTAR